MTMPTAVGCISYPIQKVIDTLNACPTFAANFTNVNYYFVDIELDAAEFLTLEQVESTRPFCLIVPNFPNGVRSRRNATFSRMQYAGTAWVKLEMNQQPAIDDDAKTYQEKMRWWDNLCGTILSELDQAVVNDPTLLDLNGWHSYVSGLSEEEKTDLQGSYFRTAFQIDWGHDI